MIYEMLKTAATNGLNLNEYFFITFVAIVGIHIGLYVLSFMARYFYGYIHDWDVELKDYYDDFLIKTFLVQMLLPIRDLTSEEVKKFPLREAGRNIGARVDLPNGWYRCTVAYYRYHKVINGIVVHEQDRDPTGGDDNWEQKAWFRVLFPIAAWIAYLLFDLQTMAIAFVAMVYLVMRISRTVVRTAKRVSNLENKDKSTTSK